MRSEHPDLAPHYQIEIRRDGALDALTVLVETHRGATSAEPAGQRAAAALGQAIKAYIGVSAAIALRDPGTIERSIGKAQRVKDTRPPI